MYKILKNKKIIGVVDYWLEKDKKHNPDLTTEEDTEHTCEDYMYVGDEYVLSDDTRAIDLKKSQVREIRNIYLDETDKYTSIPDFPIDNETRGKYIEYRKYLRDYTQIENWWEQQPKTFEEWRENEES